MLHMLLALIAGAWALRFAARKARWVRQQDPGGERMREIARGIQEGAMAFLSREYRMLGIVVGIVAALLFVAGVTSRDSSFLVALSFVAGAGCSAMAGYIGMRVATEANVRTTNAARTSLVAALQVALSGGTVMGMVVAGLGVCGLTTLFFVYTVLFGDATMRELHRAMNVLAGFSLGASSIALFARVGGGIYAEAAGTGAGVVGTVEAGIPEGDPRNPAVIAEMVGDNVGGVAGMGADLFESYVGSIVGAMVLGVAYDSVNLVILPLLVAGLGIAVSIAGTRAVRAEEGGNPQRALNRGSVAAGGLMLVLTYPLAKWLVPRAVTPVENVTGTLHVVSAGGISLATMSGLLAGIAVGVAIAHYTTEARQRQGAGQSLTGAATTVLGDLGLGLLATAWPVIFLAAAIVLAFYFAGLYGIAMAGLGMLSTIGIQLAVDAYGSIAGTAADIAEMSELGPEVQRRSDVLAALDNGSAAIGKGLAIGSAALTALALFSAYQSVAGIRSVDVGDPYVMAGMLFGAMLPFLFGAMVLRAVGGAASEMVEEVRRQFRSLPGPVEGRARADCTRCVDTAAAAAIRRMLVPGMMAVVTPVAVGLLDKHALGGMLAGVIVSGVPLAIFMGNAGGAWRNGRTYIEGGQFGGTGSDAQTAVAAGDTVGDPFKDAVGPSLNTLIKLMSVVALVLASLLA